MASHGGDRVRVHARKENRRGVEPAPTVERGTCRVTAGIHRRETPSGWNDEPGGLRPDADNRRGTAVL